MMQKFTVILPNEKKTTYKWMSLLLVVINFVAMEYIHIHALEDSFVGNVTLIWRSFFFGLIPTTLLFKKNHKNITAISLFGIFVFSIGWLIMGYVWMGFAMLLLVFMGWRANKKILVHFNNEGVFYPSLFYQKKLDWNFVDNCMLKDGILTIDLKSNKLMQFTLQESENADLDEGLFNGFVKERINS